MRDHILEPGSMAAEHALPFVPTVAANVTNRPFASLKVDHSALATALRLFVRDVTGAASVQAYRSRGDGVFGSPTLDTDTTPEDFAITTAFAARVGDVVAYKAAATGLSFSAAHVVTATKFGSILIQMTAGGTVSTLITGATQTTPMAYATAAEALAALPAPSTNNVAIGSLLIEADAGDWVANTDDLTTDLTAATWASYDTAHYSDVNGTAALCDPAPAFVDGTLVEGVLVAGVAGRVLNIGDRIVLTITGDGTAALADAQATFFYRPFPLKGEVLPE